MNLAVAGKGGVGKTTVCATLARLTARTGRPVLVVDADPNPNLATALGLPPDRPDAAPALPAAVVSHRVDGHALARPLAEVLAGYAEPAPDGVLLVSTPSPGRAGEGCLCATQAAVGALLADLRAHQPATTTLVDLEASPEHLTRGTAAAVELFCLLAEPYYRALEATARLARLAADAGLPTVVVANKVRDPADAAAVQAFCARHGLDLAGELPWDPAVTAADAAGRALLDTAPESGLVAGLRDLAPRLGLAA